MSPVEKTVCIIGCGCSGLASIKACLEEGFFPVCFEMTSDIGGLWNKDERMKHHCTPKVYSSLVTNFSKVNACFSDFPFPEEWTPYISMHQMLEYFRMYAAHFDLMRCIVFDTKVISVRPSKSYNETGSWMVQTKNLKTNNTAEREFDAVIIASGKLSKNVWPIIPGLDKYTGQIIHSSDYEEPDIFKGKSVMVIGGGNSGCDIACDSTSTARNVILSVRSGVWIAPRVFAKGLPLDMVVTNRFSQAAQKWLPKWVITFFFTKMIEARMNHQAFGIKSKYAITDPRSTTSVTDELPGKICSGKIKTRPGVKSFSANHVTFEDGRIDKVDIVVLATGYTLEIPFVSHEVFPGNMSQLQLHKWIFPFNLKHPSTLTYVGFTPPGTGSLATITDLQARFITQVLSGKKSLPSKTSMRNNWENARAAMLRETEGNFVYKELLYLYQEDIAQDLGLIPSFFKLLFSDPMLAFKLYLGPFSSYQYRLFGDHSWDEAREHSLNAIEETLSGMSKKDQ